ncbi:MAG: glycosyltransferase family 39 protein [Candidatus Poribacteria bacterium]|nr:glycosyltransferase family 39 protein [Candidatus Poribacteria bacterium]
MYMFQARLFVHGMLSAPLPPEIQFFEAAQVILSDRWYTMYPPGYPAILALGVLFRISWLVNPFLGALTVVGIYLLAKELYGDNTAKLSAILACASSFFLFMSSEFASHTATLFFVTLAFLSFVWMVKKKRSLLSSVICGASLGIALLCRPYTTVWICVPLGIAAIIARKKLSFQYILMGTIPLLVACLTFLAYNYATTGHPFLFGYIALHGKNHYPGFHQAPWSHQFHTVAQGVKYLLGNLNALNYYLFEWPIPSLLFVCVFLAYGKKRFWEWLLVGWVGTLLIGHFFYFFNQLHFGPRFVYEILPALILLTSRGLSVSTQFITSRWKTLSYAQARNILCLMLIGLFLFAFLFNMPATAKSYQNYGEDVTIQKYLNKNDVAQALVFVKERRAYWVHYPFNAPFAEPYIYAKDRGSENKKLAEKFPGYRYFIADEKKIIEVSIDEL